MGRLKARLAHSEQDRELQSHVAEVQRGLERALAVCTQAAGRRRARYARPEVRDQIRSLTRARGLLERIGHMSPMVEYGDLDTLDEDQQHILVAVEHLAKVEEPLAQTLRGVVGALEAFEKADRVIPLDSEALVEARRARAISKTLREARRLVGGVRSSVKESPELGKAKSKPKANPKAKTTKPKAKSKPPKTWE